jgi:uncharacterized protein YidB (DUF937 family)
MRLIHEVIEDLQALPDKELSPMSAALQELLGGARGSVPELVDRFTEAGLAAVMASWMGDGQHLRISTRDLQRVLGKERIADLATLAGLAPARFLTLLARLLPEAIHRMARTDARAASRAMTGRG